MARRHVTLAIKMLLLPWGWVPPPSPGTKFETSRFSSTILYLRYPLLCNHKLHILLFVYNRIFVFKRTILYQWTADIDLINDGNYKPDEMDLQKRFEMSQDIARRVKAM